MTHPLPRPHIARREPRVTVPQHRRLAAHQRSGAARPATASSYAQAL